MPGLATVGTPEELKIGDAVKVLEEFDVREGEGERTLREGLLGKVVQRASGERGFAHIKFDELSEPTMVTSKDFRKLGVLDDVRSTPSSPASQSTMCMPKTLKVGDSVKVVEVRDARSAYLLPGRDGPGLLPDWEDSQEPLSPPSSPSLGNSGRHSGQKTIFEGFPMLFDSCERSRRMEAGF